MLRRLLEEDGVQADDIRNVSDISDTNSVHVEVMVLVVSDFYISQFTSALY